MVRMIVLLWFCSSVYGQERYEKAADSLMALAMSSRATPGMAVAVVSGDKILYAKGFGVTDVTTGRAVDTNTLFYLASSTKSFTALAALIGAQNNQWNLDRPISVNEMLMFELEAF